MQTQNSTMVALTIFLILASSSHVIASSIPDQHSDTNPIRGVYYPSWSPKHIPKPSSINTSFFTHIYYAFLVPNNVTFKFDIDNQTEAFLHQFTSTLHAKNPPVKTLFSIGGGGADPSIFSSMASNPSSRSAFIKSSIYVARTYQLDGCDLDWEFAKNTKEMNNLDMLLKEWRAAVKTEAKATNRNPLLITAAVYYSADKFLDGNQRSYPVDSINKNLDWVNVMNYDYHGSWDKTATGAHAALFDPKSNLSTNFGIGNWIQAGLQKEKLVMGLPMYGRTWTLKDPTRSSGVGASAVDVGPGGGTLTYANVVSFNKANKVRGVFDKDTVSVYSVSKKSWVGYDDPTSIRLKVVFARTLGLRGYFFWSINQDYKWEISKSALDVW